VTVCIAARCIGGNIFCASDRMLTAGDIQYEPPSPKVFQLTKHVVSMMSGDAAFYTEIMDSVLRQLDPNTEDFVAVTDVADLFVHFRSEAHRKRAASAILSPLGLNSETFMSRQQELDPNLVDKLATELINYYVPEVDVIIAGIDTKGAQIYVMSGGEVTCNNAIGFASVGSGSRHAESQFMLARHSWNAPTSDTLFLTYSAKKRSEVAPGVGSATDMLMIHSDGVTSLKPDLLRKIEAVYANLTKKEEKNINLANDEVKRYVSTLTEETEEKSEGQKKNSDGESTPADLPEDQNISQTASGRQN
jgi:hypothetical protein